MLSQSWNRDDYSGAIQKKENAIKKRSILLPKYWKNLQIDSGPIIFLPNEHF